MILFSTTATAPIAKNIVMPKGACTIKRFSDGEIFVRIDEEVKNKEVWVVAGTQAPAENLIELFLLLDALKQAGAIIHLFITYFSYARQIEPLAREAHSAELIGSILSTFDLKRCFILHPHSQLLHTYLSYTDMYPLDFFCTAAQPFDAIVAPDRGARVLAEQIAEHCNKPAIHLEKTRPAHEQVKIVAVNGDVTGKRLIIVDDMIATGRTLVHAAEELIKMGAESVAAAATHGIFSNNAYEYIDTSILETVVVTNSIATRESKKVKIIDISPDIQNTIMLTL